MRSSSNTTGDIARFFSSFTSKGIKSLVKESKGDIRIIRPYSSLCRAVNIIYFPPKMRRERREVCKGPQPPKGPSRARARTLAHTRARAHTHTHTHAHNAQRHPQPQRHPHDPRHPQQHRRTPAHPHAVSVWRRRPTTPNTLTSAALASGPTLPPHWHPPHPLPSAHCSVPSADSQLEHPAAIVYLSGTVPASRLPLGSLEYRQAPCHRAHAAGRQPFVPLATRSPLAPRPSPPTPRPSPRRRGATAQQRTVCKRPLQRPPSLLILNY